MKKLARILVTAAAVYIATAATAQYQWAVKSGGTGLAYGLSAATDASNNIYVGGSYSGGSCIIGSSTLALVANDDGFLAKYNSSGTPQWAIRVAGTGNQDVKEVITDGSNIYIAGVFTGTTTFYSTNATTMSLTSSGSSDCYLAKYNSNGVVQWTIKYGGAAAESPRDIAINTSLQRIYISGNSGNSFFAVSYSYNTVPSVPVWTYSNSAGTAESYGIAADASGNCYVLASYASPTATITLPSGNYTGNHGMLLIKLNSSGSTTWVQNIGNGSSGEERGRAVDVDGAGNIYIAGQYMYTANISGISLTNANATHLDVFVAKYNSSGAVQWARKISGSGSQYINGFTVSSAGEAYAYFVNGENSTINIGCKTHSSINGNTDNKMAIVKYSPDGVVKGSLSPSIADVNGLGANSIFMAGSGNIVTTGHLYGTSIFGGTTLSMTGNMFVAKAIIFDETATVASNDVHICGVGSTATLVATGPLGSTLKWYSPSTTLLYTGTTYTTLPVSVLSSTVYYVSSTVSGCESEKIPVRVTAHAVNTITASVNTPTICNGSCVTVTFTNAATAVLTPGSVVKTSPFVICPTSSTTYTLTNTAAGYCEVPGTFSVNVIVTDSFAGTFSDRIVVPSGSGCTPAISAPSKPGSNTPVINTASMPTVSSNILNDFRCGIGNTLGWMGAGAVGVNNLTFVGSYTLDVYEVETTSGTRKVVNGQIAPSVFLKYGVSDGTDDMRFNEVGWGSGFDDNDTLFFCDGSADGDGNNGNGDYFRDFYRYCYDEYTSTSTTAAFDDFSSRVFCIDMKQVSTGGCTISKKTYFRIAYDTDLNKNNGSGARIVMLDDEATNDKEQYRSLEIFPNPTSSIVYIPLASDNRDVQVTITDNLGKQVLKVNNLENNEGQLNMEALPAGIYFYTILKDNTTYKGKIVKH